MPDIATLPRSALSAMEKRLAAEQIKRQAQTDYELFAREFLRIRTKSGAIVPLVFNRAQRHIHERLEEQKAKTGKVRAMILKGRQQGCSTYIGGRFYHRCSRNGGLRTFILTHEDQATQNLFEMVCRFHENLPKKMRPSTGIANAKELVFDQLDSGYKIGTAYTTGVGRSSTLQLFHGSEVAHWRNADIHAAGVLQAIPHEPGTEAVLESTAAGVGNWYHRKWTEAEAGHNEYITIFTPWFWSDEYAVPVGPDFTLDVEEREHAEMYGLSNEQMAWRRSKLIELGDPLLFKQEYPTTAAEAFQMSGHDSFISPLLIARARASTPQPSGPLVIGVDPAWTGKARTAIAFRRGRCVEKVLTRTGLDTMATAGWVAKIIKDDSPARVFIDVGGVGAGVVDRLNEQGFSIRAVNFGSAPMEPAATDPKGKPDGGPANRRAEMWMRSKAWLEDPAGVNIPDNDELQADACGPGYRYDSSTRLLLERKEDMRKRGVPSPDTWDAVALTFAEPVSDGPRLRLPFAVSRSLNWMTG